MSQERAKPKTTRFILIATLVIVALVTLYVGWQKGWLVSPHYDTPPFSADYLPADTSAVLHIDLRKTQDSKYVKKNFGSILDSYRDQYVTKSTQQALGVDATKDIDWAQVIVTEGDREHPLVLLAGAFEPTRFKLSEKGLHQVNKRGDRYRLYELPDEALQRKFTLAPGDHLLLLSDNPQLVHHVLADAEANRSPPLTDTLLAEVLAKVDRKQAVWGAASLKQTKPVFKVSFLVDEAIQRIIQATEAIYGGIICGVDVEAKVYFVTGSEVKSLEVEKQLRDLCGLALLGENLPGNDKPLLKLLASGDVKREGNTVILHCHQP